MNTLLEIKNISKSFGQTKILQEMNLSVGQGEFLVLVGPSGCGKSTLLRLIAGLEEPTEGEVWISGKDMTMRAPKDRHIAMVFQQYALYPHMSVLENMAFGLRVRRRLSESEIQNRVHNAAEMLQLTPYLQRKPKELSGGQRQRVALGRAIVRKPRIFLFDEPLSNLDAQLRTQMRVELKKIHSLLGNTMIYVTHDQVEATTMGDRIAILNKGQIQQIDTPVNLYWKPINRFVAGFIGVPEMNFIEGKLTAMGNFQFGDQTLKLGKTIRETACTLGMRPEFLNLLDAPIEDENCLVGEVEVLENLGAQTLVHVLFGDTTCRVLCPNTRQVNRLDKVAVHFDMSKAQLFDKNSGRSLLY